MRLRTVLLVFIAVVISAAAAALFTVISSPGPSPARPALAALPPLQPLARTSTVLAPTAIALTAIRDALEAQAPRNLSGKPQNPGSQLLSNAQLSFSVTRGPFVVANHSDALTITTPLTGTFEAVGTLAGGAGAGAGAVGGAVGGTIGNLIGSSGAGQQIQHLAGGAFNQHADLHGTVVTTSRPAIAANWRLAPNLAGQVNVADVTLPIASVKLNVASAVKPTLDGMVHEQIAALDTRLRNDPFIENVARAMGQALPRDPARRGRTGTAKRPGAAKSVAGD